MAINLNKLIFHHFLSYKDDDFHIYILSTKDISKAKYLHILNMCVGGLSESNG